MEYKDTGYPISKKILRSWKQRVAEALEAGYIQMEFEKWEATKTNSFRNANSSQWQASEKAQEQDKTVNRKTNSIKKL